MSLIKILKGASQKLNPKEVEKVKNKLEKQLGELNEKVKDMSEKVHEFTEKVEKINLNEKPGTSKKIKKEVEEEANTFWYFPDEPHMELNFSDLKILQISEILESLTITDCPSTDEAYKLLTKVDFSNNSSTSQKTYVVTFKINEELCDEKIEKFDSIFNGVFPIVVVLESNINGAFFIFWKLDLMTNCHAIKMFEPEIKEAKEFILDFIMRSIRDDHRVTMDFTPNSDHTINIISLKDSRGYNMLMLAAEAGNLKVVKQLLSFGFSINLSVDEKTAADLAFENQHHDVLLELLKSDSKYPNNYNESNNFTNDITKFFTDLEENQIESIKEFLSHHPNLRYIYNTQNITAASKAITLKKFEIYEILLDHNVFMAPDEEMEDITRDFDDDELSTLKEIHQKSAKEDPEKHIKILTAISKTGHDEQKVEERIKIIEEAYRALDKIPDVQPLLKAVAECRGATIYFDFNRVWVNYMDPSLSVGVNGAFYPNGRVYIAAKDLLDPSKMIEALAVIAHEFCHFAVHLGFKNMANPYERNDVEGMRNFNLICEEYRVRLNLERIIRDVYDFYPTYFYHAELIVRVPQLLILYSGNPEALERCQIEYSRLFAFYNEVILPRVRGSISSVENFLMEQLKKKLESFEIELKIKNDKVEDLEEEIVNERSKTKLGRVGVSPSLNTDAPVHVMEIRDVDGKKEFSNNYTVINQILLQPEVVDRKIVVVSIIGEHRKGKSFFLDFCLRFMYSNYSSVSKTTKPTPPLNWMGDTNEPLKGFSWKHGYAADTKGILFWPDVFLHNDPLEKIAIILMDTQGLFELKSTFQENARIFSLSTLISSIQIVNIQGVMQENLVEYLEMATNLTKFISQKKISGEKPSWKPFQKLLFLLRDWADEEVGLKYEGGEKYLKDFLNIDESSNNKAKIVRENIQKSFDSIKCFLLNHPGLQVNRRDFKGELSKLDPDFVENLKDLIESVLKPENLIKKSILGKEVSSCEFRDFIYCYFKAFRSIKLPEDENILQMMIDNQMKVIVENQLKTYQIIINNEVDFNQPDFQFYLQQKHDQAKTEAIAGFLTTEKLEDESSIEKSIKLLQSEIENCFKLWKDVTMREYQRFQQHKELVEKLETDIKRQIMESIQKQREYEERIKNQQENTEELNMKIATLTSAEREKQQKMEEFQRELQNSKKELNKRTLDYEEIVAKLKAELGRFEESKPYEVVSDIVGAAIGLGKLFK